MLNKIIVFAAVLISSTLSFETYAAGCSPSISNISCATATPVVSGAACVDGSVCNGGSTSAGSSCLYSGDCGWYEFTATATDMWVNIEVTNTGGCHISSAVYESSGGACSPLTELSCQSGAPLDDIHSLNGLTVGGTYYVEICYSPGMFCGSGVEYCISVGEPAPPCDQCSSPCWSALGYASPPTTQTVVDDCTTPPFVPELQPSSTHTFCYSFTATATSVDFNAIITSNCGGGNVTNFSWELFNYPSCGSAIQSGTLSNLTFSPLVIGNDYVFCYTFTVPSTCTHSQHCPYFVGATVLPIQLADFSATVSDDKVALDWETFSELNNDYFTVERTRDGIHFEEVGRVDGAGNSTERKSYRLIDHAPYKGKSYYRLKQTDFDGAYAYSSLISVDMAGMMNNVTVRPNPMSGNGFVQFTSSVTGTAQLEVLDVFGNIVSTNEFEIVKGSNEIALEGRYMNSGVYFIKLSYQDEVTTVRFVKD